MSQKVSKSQWQMNRRLVLTSLWMKLSSEELQQRTVLSSHSIQRQKGHRTKVTVLESQRSLWMIHWPLETLWAPTHPSPASTESQLRTPGESGARPRTNALSPAPPPPGWLLTRSARGEEEEEEDGEGVKECSFGGADETVEKLKASNALKGGKQHKSERERPLRSPWSLGLGMQTYIKWKSQWSLQCFRVNKGETSPF